MGEMQVKSLIVIFILFKFVINSDGFLLHGSAGPLTARLRGAVLLPCFVDRPLPLEELELNWRRTDSDTIVHLFQGGQSRPESQGDAYRGRAHFFSHEIPKGNFSLLLEGVRTADAGVYKCVVYTEQEQHETRVEIQEVECLRVTGADEPVYAHAGEDVTLNCSVDTHVNVTELQVKWQKTDDGEILVLLYADGENRPESQDRRYSGRAEFFTEEIPKGNFSMKLRNVRTEDTGEFSCEVLSDTDSASTTARIAALGYSSLHLLILGLCIAVTPVVILTGALSVRHLIREGERSQALLSHCSHVIVPQIMVIAAFILWGVTEGSTEDIVTCVTINVLYIHVLFMMAPYQTIITDKWQLIIRTSLRIVFPIIMVFVLTGSFIQFSAKFFPTPTEKVIFGGVFGGIIFMFIIFLILRIIDVVLLRKYSNEREKRVKIRNIVGIITGVTFLIILLSFIIAVGVFLKNNYSDANWKGQLGIFSSLLLLPIIMFFFPADVSPFRKILSQRMGRAVQFRYLLVSMFYFMYNSRLFNVLILAIYSQIFAWINNTFKLEYSIPIAVVAVGLCALIIIKDYYLYNEKKRLEGFSYFAQKILLGIFLMLHIILSFLYLNVVLENDKGRPVKICEFVFIYILTVTLLFLFWQREHLLAKPRKYVYFSGVFGLPLLNSVALAVALKVKADTGKQSQSLRLVVLISGSVFFFSWFVIEMSAYWLAKKQKIKRQLGLVERLHDTELELLQQPILPANIPDPLTDLGKRKLIREQLLLLLHARRCQRHKQTNREEWSCSRPQCRTMRKVLKHIDSCQAGMTCQVKHCTSSCKLISHWENCTQHDCPICMPQEDFSNQRSNIDDSEKLELIQAQLLLLLHAQECQQREQANGEEYSCTKPQCCDMRKVLKHMDSCQADMTCQEHLCTFSRQLISHWETCTEDDCLTLHFTKKKGATM